MIPNITYNLDFISCVVNCFQNCIFTYDSQRISFGLLKRLCCELLSELYFYLWFPTMNITIKNASMLWIAFRIVFLLMIPNQLQILEKYLIVVNCFQNCIFTYDSQQIQICFTFSVCCELLSELYFYLWFPTDATAVTEAVSCELLSELYFYLWFPTKMAKPESFIVLWIAFRIVFLLMIPNIFQIDFQLENVVNCFQNCIFTYDSQHFFTLRFLLTSCELLSELYFYLWFPTI